MESYSPGLGAHDCNPQARGRQRKVDPKCKANLSYTLRSCLKTCASKNIARSHFCTNGAWPLDIGDRVCKLVMWIDAPFPDRCELRFRAMSLFAQISTSYPGHSKHWQISVTGWIWMLYLPSGKPKPTWKPYFPNSYVKGCILSNNHYSINYAFSTTMAYVTYKDVYRWTYLKYDL